MTVTPLEWVLGRDMKHGKKILIIITWSIKVVNWTKFVIQSINSTIPRLDTITLPFTHPLLKSGRPMTIYKDVCERTG